MPSTIDRRLKNFLDGLVDRFESRAFIRYDPIAIPHGFDDPRDQEVIGLYAALLAWGRRDTVLQKMEDLCNRMRYRPYRFVRDFRIERDSSSLRGFRHRTFKEEDAIWLTANLGTVLRQHGTLQHAFGHHAGKGEQRVKAALEGFSQSVLAADPSTPARLSKHVARPSTGSACKRLNMYLRWMVRPGPFDLGIWRTFSSESLVIPLDVHSGTQARRLGMLGRTSDDWKAAIELTRACSLLDADDPCRYDLALFGIGAYEVPIPADLLSAVRTPYSIDL